MLLSRFRPCLTVQVTSSIDVPAGRAQPSEIRLDQVRSTAGSLGLNSTLSPYGAASVRLPTPVRLRAPSL